MKFILALSFSIGSSVLPSCMSAPEPLAHQCLALMPSAMNKTAQPLGDRIGGAGGFAGGCAAEESAPQTGIDSSQGSAIATPAPRRIVRRESRSRSAALRSFMLGILDRTSGFSSLISEMLRPFRGSVRLESLTYFASPRRLFKNCGLVTMVSTSIPNR